MLCLAERSIIAYFLIILFEVFYKPENAVFWQYRSYNKLEDVIELESINVEVSLNDIFLDWEFTP
ncbi:hypothetical protein GCM10027035_15850 [Emticicia sediminis]